MKAGARPLVAVLLLATIGLGLWLAPPAIASCVGPSAAVSPDQGSAGSEITITGQFYWDRCNDVIRCVIYTPTPSPSPGDPTPSPSATSTCEEPEPAQPLEDIRIEFVQGGRVWQLGTVDADHEGEIRLEAEVPAEADFGNAKVRACPYESGCNGPSAEFRVAGVLSEKLARTGTNVGGFVTTGLVALAVGLLLAGLARSSARALR